jgi:polyisoprenoid-binding protein YceI
VKHFFIAASLLVLATPVVIAQTSTWTPDPNHTEVNFVVKHLGIANVRGHFGKVTGTFQVDPNDMTKSSVNVTIDVTGVNTAVAPRDNDLKSARFFDVAEYPTATFASTGMTKASDGYTVAGNLTMRGVTRPVTLHLDPPAGPIKDAKNITHMGFSATGTINRKDWGVGAFESNTIVSDRVQLEIDADAVKQ